tara:strand:- start:2335 stop:4221 length:1887 start_codon:yes stop_codon:yes gene_type:complete
VALVPIVPIENVGQYGIVTDIPPFQLPPNAWSGGNNVQVRNNGIKKCAGFVEVFASCPIPPHHIFPVADSTSVYWIALGLEKAYVFKNSGGSWTDITRTAGVYTSTEEEGWSSTVIGGVPVMTNFKEAPQFWAFASGAYATGTKLVELSNWQNSAYYCKSIKSFKTFLIALNIEKSGTPYTKMVKWSNQAASHAPPTSWDESDATKDAGEYELTDTPGDIIDGLQLGESFMIYKDDAIYIMNYIGTPFMFSFRMLSPTVGILAKNCVSEFSGGHFFFGKTNIYLNDGQKITPLLTDRLRREVFDNLDGDNFKKSFTVADYNRNEMLACYPTGGYSYPNKAVIWNWGTGTLTIRDLPNPTSMGFGVAFVSTDSDEWDDATPEWDDAGRVWGSATFAKGAENLVFCVPGTSTGVISAATQANPVRITTATAHNLTSGDKIIIDNVVGMTELNAPAGSAYPAAGVLYAKIDATSPETQFTLYTDAAMSTSLDGTGFTAYSGSTGNIYKQRLFKDNDGNTEDGANMRSYIERTGISLTQDGTPDQSQVKYVRAVWPKMEVSDTGTVDIWVAKQMFPEEAVTWAGPYTFNPNSQSKVSCTVSGRYYGIRVESNANVDWTLNGLGFEIEDAGYR